MNQNRTARVAGVCFLLMVLFGCGAELFFRQRLFVPGDAATTAASIAANGFVVRAGILSDLLMALFYMLTALVLYRLFADMDKHLSALMVVFAVAGSVLLMFTVLYEMAPLFILSGSGDLKTFSNAQLQSLAMLFYTAYQHGYMIGQIFFALWVLPLGILIIRSTLMPKVLGMLFVAETVCGLMAVIVHFLLPNDAMETVLLLPGMLAEFSFMFWLLIKGVRAATPLPLGMLMTTNNVDIGVGNRTAG
jgi:predicted secreted protein